MHLARRCVDLRNQVLVQRWRRPQELARLAVQGVDDAGLTRNARYDLVRLAPVECRVDPLHCRRVRPHARVHQQAFEDVVHVPVVPGQVLVVPGDLSRFLIEGQGRVGIQHIAARRSPDPFQGRGRYRCAPVDQAQGGIVAAASPGADVTAVFPGQVAPTVAARLFRADDGVPAPDLRAGVWVVGSDIAGGGTVGRRTGAAADHLAAHDHGPGGEISVHRHLPEETAVAGVECDQVRFVLGEVEYPVLVDRDVAHTRLAGGHGFAAVFPDEVSGSRIERLDDIPWVSQEHGAVVDQGRGFLFARFHGPGPGQGQTGHVFPADLIERTESPGVPGAPVHQPVAGVRVAQFRRRDGHEPVHRSPREGMQLDFLQVRVAERAHVGYQRNKFFALNAW